MAGIIPEIAPAMTVPSEQSRITYDTDGTSVSFPVPFRFLQNRDLRVTLIAADDSSRLLVLDVDYSVAGAGQQSGGTLSTVTPAAASQTLLIERIVAITQETAYQRNDPFPERAHERALDKLTMIDQQIGGILGMTPGSVNRALLLGDTDRDDGSGSYRARGNRIRDVGDPVSMNDAVNKQTMTEALSGLAADGSGEFVVERLADGERPDNGAGMIAANPLSEFPHGTVGHALGLFVFIEDVNPSLGPGDDISAVLNYAMSVAPTRGIKTIYLRHNYRLSAPLVMQSGVSVMAATEGAELKLTPASNTLPYAATGAVNFVGVVDASFSVPIDMNGNTGAYGIVTAVLFAGPTSGCEFKKSKIRNFSPSSGVTSFAPIMLMAISENGDIGETSSGLPVGSVEKNNIHDIEIDVGDGVYFGIRVLTDWIKARPLESSAHGCWGNDIRRVRFNGKFSWDIVELAGTATAYNTIDEIMLDDVSAMCCIDFDKGASFNRCGQIRIRKFTSAKTSGRFVSLISSHGTDGNILSRENRVDQLIIEGEISHENDRDCIIYTDLIEGFEVGSVVSDQANLVGVFMADDSRGDISINLNCTGLRAIFQTFGARQRCGRVELGGSISSTLNITAGATGIQSGMERFSIKPGSKISVKSGVAISIADGVSELSIGDAEIGFTELGESNEVISSAADISRVRDCNFFGLFNRVFRNLSGKAWLTGNDGASKFPAVIISGGSVIDNSSNSWNS